MNRPLTIVIGFVFLTIIGLWAAIGSLASPAYSQIGPLPNNEDIEAVVVEGVHGWYIPAKEHKGCVLLMHGVWSNRLEMVGRSRFLRDQGYSSFAIDLQAHGETPGDKITFGYLESNSARAAVRFLYGKKACRKVVALGNSLGGAASLLGKEPLKVDGYILEAVYPSIEVAVTNRLKMFLGVLGEMLSPLLYIQIPARLGVDLNSLTPLDAIKNIRSPVLIINGTEDTRTTLNEARLLYENAPFPKQFYQVEGARHTNLYEYDRENYKKVIMEFLSKYIGENA